MTLQCPALSEYVQLWLSFRDAELRAEIIQHREDCPVCIALKEATNGRRANTNPRAEIPIEFPPNTSPAVRGILLRLYTIISIRPGDIGWVDPDAGSEVWGLAGGVGTGEQVGDLVSEATGIEVME